MELEHLGGGIKIDIVVFLNRVDQRGQQLHTDDEWQCSSVRI
jgi:hypothetical protein